MNLEIKKARAFMYSNILVCVAFGSIYYRFSKSTFFNSVSYVQTIGIYIYMGLQSFILSS